MKTWKAVVGIGLLILGASYLTLDYVFTRIDTSCESMFESIEEAYSEHSVKMHLPYTVKFEDGVRWCEAADENSGDSFVYKVTVSDDGNIFWEGYWE